MLSGVFNRITTKAATNITLKDDPPAGHAHPHGMAA